MGALLDMVAKARKKLGHKTQMLHTKDILDFSDPVGGLSSAASLQAPKFVISPRWNPPPPVDYFLNGQGPRIGSFSKPLKTLSKKDALKSSKSKTYDYDIYEAQRSLEAAPESDGGLNYLLDIDADIEADQKVSDEEERREKELNFECVRLRQRLESKIGAGVGVGMSKPFSPIDTDHPPPLQSKSSGMTASDALAMVGGIDSDSAAAKLLQQWAEEDRNNY